MAANSYFLAPMMALALLFCLGASAAPAGKTVGIQSPGIVLAPYVWKPIGAGTTSSVEATMPGAYARLKFQGSATVGLTIDGAANAGCPDVSMPVVEYTVDNRPYQVVPLTNKSEAYTLPLAQGLDPAASHTAEVIFRAADLEQNRWRASTAHLRLTGFALDVNGQLLHAAARPKRAIGFGDSITEGVGVDAHFTSWEILAPNNARATWLPEVCSGLNAEYGQLGSGGQGMFRPVEMPPLPQTWDKYDANTSRLTNGKLTPEPDYIFCMMGTNDPNLSPNVGVEALVGSNQTDFMKAYLGWLAAIREAAPHARIYCIIPPIGYHDSEIWAIVQARHQSHDNLVFLVDTAPLKDNFGFGPSRMSYDVAHLHVYGQAMLASLILARVKQTASE